MPPVERSLCDFFKNRSGNISIVFGLSLLAMAGSIGLGLDFGRWSHQRSSLQDATDAASLAGVRALVYAILENDQDKATQRAETTAGEFLAANEAGQSRFSISVSTRSPVSVTIKAKEVGKQTVSAVLNPNSVEIGSNSVAVAIAAEDACVIALDPTASPGIEFGLSGKVVADGCSIWSNSNATQSLVGNGSGDVSADATCAVGSVALGGGLSVSPKPRSDCFPVIDPLAHWQPPTYPAGCTANNLLFDKPGTYVLSPGVYCGGITVKGKATLRLTPGLYVIKGGELLVEGGGGVRGTNVSFLMEDGATVNFGGASVVDLIAPSSGDMAGMLIASDRDEPQGTSIFRGSSEFRMEGHLYLPTQQLRFAGGPEGTFPAAYSTAIGRTVKFEGSSVIRFRKNEGSGPNYAAKAIQYIYLEK